MARWVESITMNLDLALLRARALIVSDLAACGWATARTVSIVESAVAGRRWWIEKWPAGIPYVAGQIAQDVQEVLAERYGRWPICPLHEDDEPPHELRITPDLGEDPSWICEEHGVTLAPLGQLAGWVPAGT
jgi:hypothetical protein